jgi:AbiV family abortive infection protein
MRTTLSKYKFKRLASESLHNALRLHADAILLYKSQSYPSSFQLSVLALEELAKAKWVSHYYYSSITNEGFPPEVFEQGWLSLLYSHSEKQFSFVARDIFHYSPKLVRFIQTKQLDLKKQQATYVGLGRKGRRIDVAGRISTPASVKAAAARQIISLVNAEFLDAANVIAVHGEYFGIPEVDSVIDSKVHAFVFAWPHKSGLKSRGPRAAQHYA